VEYLLINFIVAFQNYAPNTPNPATPGAYTGPYTPNTPGAGMYGSEPTYSPYTQSPSPGGYGNPVTPGGSIAPVSPAYNPQTPGAGLEEPGPGDWVTTDIEVRINMNHEVSSVFFQFLMIEELLENNKIKRFFSLLFLGKRK
jgi:hypothetical protein